MTLPDCVKLEMDLAALMAQQQASGFRFDVEAAERVRGELQEEMDESSRQFEFLSRRQDWCFVG